jgi:hypothetical protein
MRAIIINAQERTVSEAEIEGSLKSLQNIVGGLIDPVYPGLVYPADCRAPVITLTSMTRDCSTTRSIFSC